MANIANFNPSKVTTGRLKPELQAIFDELPVLIDYCERNGQILSEQIIEEIKDEINLTPERREQVIITHRDKFAERYKELIISGLRLKATDKDDILETIGLLMYVKGTWELPMPKDCGFESIKPDPKGYFHAMIAPVFNNYAFIQACNVLLSHTDDNGTQPKGLNTNYDADKLNKIFDNLQNRKIVKKGDKVKFAALFTDKFISKVDWDCTIYGAKAGLFDLMERITGKKMTASNLKLRFDATDIHDKWRDKNGGNTKLIDEIMEGI
jgi:hypothetical protein